MIALLAQEIRKQMEFASNGHCARVNFLPREQARDLCHFLNKHAPTFLTRILATRFQDDPLVVTVDQAIELRNSKTKKLCLIVPADLSDAAYSSLSNAFAVIDSRTILKKVLEHLTSELPARAQTAIRFAGQRRNQASVENRIDYALAVKQGNNPGLALWHLGLIADGRIEGGSATFDEYLKPNRDCVQALAHPNRLSASSRDRIQAIKVNATTESRLNRFFCTGA